MPGSLPTSSASSVVCTARFGMLLVRRVCTGSRLSARLVMQRTVRGQQFQPVTPNRGRYFSSKIELSPYDVLGVSPRAPLSELREAYHRKALLCHPDRPGGNAARFSEINGAYNSIVRGTIPSIPGETVQAYRRSRGNCKEFQKICSNTYLCSVKYSYCRYDNHSSHNSQCWGVSADCRF